MAALRENNVMFNTLLNQGKKYLDIQGEYKYLVDPHLKLIEETSSPQLGSIIENFSQNYYDKLNQVAAQQDPAASGTPPKGSFQDLINQYNSILKQYQSTSESILRPNSSTNIDTTKVQALNGQLIDLIKDMDALVEKQLVSQTRGDPAIQDIQAGSGELGAGDQPSLLAARAALNNQNTLLNQQRMAYDEQVNILNTLMGEDEDVKIRRRSAYYQFLVWSIVSVTLIAYTTKYALSV